MATNTPLGFMIPTVEASGAIFNPWYQLPRIYIVSSDPTVGRTDSNPPITPTCRVELPAYDLTLFFQRDKITFLGKSEQAYKSVEPLLLFLAYRTFIHYNIHGFALEHPDEIKFPELDPIPFTLEQIIRVESEALIDGKLTKMQRYEGRSASRNVSVESIATFLKVLDRSLYSAIFFYLRGCFNPTYFLVEYYKAVESIVNVYGGQKKFFSALQRHGITKALHSEFGKFSNDTQFAPVDIGRHAPDLNASVHSFDMRTMLYDPRSREIFEKATGYCRNVIDAYLFELSHATGTKPRA